MLLVDNASIFIFNNILGHSQREAMNEIRRISSDNGFPTRFILDFSDNVPHLLDPISHEINGLFMVQLVRSHDVLRRYSRQVFLKGFNVDLLIEVKMADLSLIIFETLGPFGGIDEFYSKLVVVLTFYSDQSQQQSFWPQGASYGFCSGLDVIDPVDSAETDHCIKLSHIFELSVQISFKISHLGFRTILFLGDFYQISRNVVSVEFFDLNTVCLQPFLHIVRLLAITATNIYNRYWSILFFISLGYQLNKPFHRFLVHLVLSSIPFLVKFIERLCITFESPLF